MARLFCVRIALSTIWMTLLPAVVLAKPIVNSRYPEVPRPYTNTLSCYIQTTDGRTLDLDSLCNKTTDDNGNSVRNRAINTNSDSNIGVNGCYGLDAAGRPCGSATSEGQETRTDLVPSPTI